MPNTSKGRTRSDSGEHLFVTDSLLVPHEEDFLNQWSRLLVALIVPLLLYPVLALLAFSFALSGVAEAAGAVVMAAPFVVSGALTGWALFSFRGAAAFAVAFTATGPFFYRLILFEPPCASFGLEGGSYRPGFGPDISWPNPLSWALVFADAAIVGCLLLKKPVPVRGGVAFALGGLAGAGTKAFICRFPGMAQLVPILFAQDFGGVMVGHIVGTLLLFATLKYRQTHQVLGSK